MTDTGRRGKSGLVATMAAMLTALAAGLAAAQELDCTDPITNVEMTACAGKDYEAADKKLNATYQTVMADLRKADADAGDGGDRAGKLRDAQRAWIDFKERSCELEAATMYGGTGAPLVGTLCLTQMTQRRTSELESIRKLFVGN